MPFGAGPAGVHLHFDDHSVEADDGASEISTTVQSFRPARSALARAYSLTGTSVTLDEAAAAFEAEVDNAIQLAESELRLTRLAAEIQRTSRRVNTLQHVLIPRLVAERNYIQMALDERERGDHFRLKRVKQTLRRKNT